MFKRCIPLVSRGICAHLRYNSTVVDLTVAGLKTDLKQAMINKDDVRKTTIRGILSSIKNKTIDAKDHSIDEFGIFDLYSKMITQRVESIDSYTKNSRDDLAEREKQELQILQDYQNKLPVASQDEVNEKVLDVLKASRDDDSNLELKQVFGKFDWGKLPKQWRTSPNTIRSSIVSQYKTVFK
ncbi:Aim41p KNAG_0A03180 [Huiozyma naganishii CBS 8797]|uniref:Altered inheritance of mitochondria protein 41 n=1 Tax=Huiozyma naganishii (strain ATCC MYA-139 / BCRC 22969 / CBS 8797 / KCTC 17520 / NBRC 10181 / NCYC 3082 / Yp74L-3) TaxID=1071383 RepID=J7QZT6_HUIN7|nr:hypothetical protein KNAG_0A03180 [Kazachstania naganishii CBS 8797]CCK68005.1 hypothetical protein KNAG_0A03180 [Kazachstania naganishii CBS 8797]